MTSNLQGLLTLSKWISALLESWTAVVVFVWRKILFFLPEVYAVDALILTFVSFVAVNVFLCSQRGETGRTRILSLLAGLVVVIVIFSAGLLAVVPQGGIPAPGYFPEFLRTVDTLLGNLATHLREWGEGSPTPVVLIPAFIALLLYLLLLCAVVPLVPVAILYAVVRGAGSFRLSYAALSRRLWRIIGGICLLISANYLALWIEQERWFEQMRWFEQIVTR